MEQQEYSKSARVAVFALVVLYTAYFSYLAVDRWNLMLCGMDHAIIDSATHSTAIGRFMWSPQADFNYWVQHISPILLFLSAFYVFSDNYWFAFVYETVTIGLAGIPLFLIASKKLRSEWLGVLAVAAFFLTGTLQIANLFEYHMEGHESLFIFAAVYAAMAKRWRLYFVSIILLAFCKEDAFIASAMVAMYVFIAEKEYRIAILSWVILGVYALALFKIGYPYFRGNNTYHYSSYYSWMGDSPFQIAYYIITHPMELISQRLAYDEAIPERWGRFVIEHGYITPLFSPLGVIMALPVTMELFLAARGHLFGLSHHYPFHVIPFWILAMTFGLGNIKRGLEWFASMLEKRGFKGFGGKPASILNCLLLLVAVFHIGAVIYFLAFGQFDFTVLSARIYMRDIAQPMQIGACSLVLWLILSNSRPATYFGTTAGFRVVLAIMIFILGAKLYNGNDYGAMPFYSLWSREIKTYDREHAAKVRELIKLIPRGAVVVANPGIFAHLHHHTEAYVSIKMPPLEQRKVTHLILDSKDPMEYLRDVHRDLIGFLASSKNYVLVKAVDGAALFVRGDGSAENYAPFVELEMTSACIGAFHNLSSKIAACSEDKSSTFGYAIEAKRGMSGTGDFLVYGPYMQLKRGEYVALFRMKTNAAAANKVAEIEVTAGEGSSKLAGAVLSGADFKTPNDWKTFKLPFAVNEFQLDKVELRVRYFGNASLSVDMTRFDMPRSTFQNYLQDEKSLSDWETSPPMTTAGMNN